MMTGCRSRSFWSVRSFCADRTAVRSFQSVSPSSWRGRVEGAGQQERGPEMEASARSRPTSYASQCTYHARYSPYHARYSPYHAGCSPYHAGCHPHHARWSPHHARYSPYHARYSPYHAGCSPYSRRTGPQPIGSMHLGPRDGHLSSPAPMAQRHPNGPPWLLKPWSGHTRYPCGGDWECNQPQAEQASGPSLRRSTLRLAIRSRVAGRLCAWRAAGCWLKFPPTA